MIGLPNVFVHKITDPGSPVKMRWQSQTDTVQFRRWFGKSKLKNENGTPMILYHGTDAYGEVNVFRGGKSGYLGPGIYLSDKDYIAKGYANKSGDGGRVYQLYARVENPLVVTDDIPAKGILNAIFGKSGGAVYERRTARQENYSQIVTKADIQKLQSKGYDGIIWKYGTSPMEVSVFDPRQVKSATDNNGTFDRNNPDRRYSLPEIDTLDMDYQRAVDSGDTETAQRIVDEAAQAAGYTIHAYHGTARADRVGNVFRPDRATSGPMAFFTSDRSVAENYAKGKQDTSLAYDERYDSYETQFRASKDGQDLSLIEIYDKLPAAARAKIRNMAPHVTLDDEAESVVYDPKAKNGLGNYDYAFREHGRNPIAAMVEGWLTDGTLYGEEGRFLEVLEKAGVTQALQDAGWSVPEYMNPDAREERVYDTYLKIENPFNTGTQYNDEFLNGLEEWWASQDQEAYRKESSGADTWDKNNRTVEEWIDWARRDIQEGRTLAWTSIPDAVTDYLKSMGHDGIQDTGGKSGGASHTVYIPFTGEQVKDSGITYDDAGVLIPLSRRFNQQDNDIRYSLDEGAPPMDNSDLLQQIREEARREIRERMEQERRDLGADERRAANMARNNVDLYERRRNGRPTLQDAKSSIIKNPASRVTAGFLFWWR